MKIDEVAIPVSCFVYIINNKTFLQEKEKKRMMYIKRYLRKGSEVNIKWEP